MLEIVCMISKDVVCHVYVNARDQCLCVRAHSLRSPRLCEFIPIHRSVCNVVMDIVVMCWRLCV